MSDQNATKSLPGSPNITQLKKQAKDLKRAFLDGSRQAMDRVSKFHPSGGSHEGFTLRDAQVTIAREYGFEGWHQLSTFVGEQMVDQRDLHRWFGTQLNNTAWDAIVGATVSPDSPRADREAALYSAYASAYHWRTVGNEANWARGEHLISRTATLVGERELALQHAQRCLDLVRAHPDVMEDWDEPFAHEALARAFASLGDLDSARRSYEMARVLTASVADDGDRGVLEGELAREPWFGVNPPVA